MADENGGPALVAVTTLFLVLGWLSLSSRLSVRIFLTKAFDVDDWLMITAMVSSSFPSHGHERVLTLNR
jgi:hypothetical protein